MARYLARNAESERRFSFLDGPITANNPMGVHHAWGRTYKDLFQRYHTMLGERQRYQNGFDCQGLWIEVEVEKRARLQQQAPDRVVRHRSIRRALQAAGRPVRRADQRAEQAPRLLDELGQQLLHELRREQLHDLGLPGRVPPAGAALPGPRRDALVPALRHRHQQHGDGRGLPRRDAPVGDAAPAGHEPRARGRGSARLDDDAVDAVEQRRRRRASRADVPARRGQRWPPMVGERRIEGARGRRRRRHPRGARRGAGGPHLRRALRRAAGRGRGRPSGDPVERGR